jgi:hypothetical protein
MKAASANAAVLQFKREKNQGKMPRHIGDIVPVGPPA